MYYNTRTLTCLIANAFDSIASQWLAPKIVSIEVGVPAPFGM